MRPELSICEGARTTEMQGNWPGWIYERKLYIHVVLPVVTDIPRDVTRGLVLSRKARSLVIFLAFAQGYSSPRLTTRLSAFLAITAFVARVPSAEIRPKLTEFTEAASAFRRGRWLSTFGFGFGTCVVRSISLQRFGSVSVRLARGGVAIPSDFRRPAWSRRVLCLAAVRHPSCRANAACAHSRAR